MVMDDLIKAMETFIHKSTQTYNNWPYANKAKIKNWRICAALIEDGWECVGGETPEEDVNAITMIWRKEGREEKKVTLSFTEQQLWVKYLEKRAKENNNGKSS
jgi:hypothetical protein